MSLNFVSEFDLQEAIIFSVDGVALKENPAGRPLMRSIRAYTRLMDNLHTTMKNDVDAQVEARSVTVGDDLTIDSNGVAQFGGSDEVAVLNGDIIYGAFDKVKVDSNDYVIAYIGR